MIDFTHTLLAWYGANKRDLPWRNTSNPYLIWLSEIILQQTRIQQGWAYWEHFVERFPTVHQLAEATEDEVLRLWQGLGYYSRARNLHTAAKQIVAMGHFPNTMEEIKSLKGVGDYTAAAIGSMAFHLPVAVVDGNVYRVLARYYAIDTPINSTEGKKLFQELAQSLLPTNQAADFNQAMMDFGAIQCMPSSPKCTTCPLMEGCEAFRTARVATFPVKLKTLKVKTRHLHYYYILHQGEVAMRRRGEGDIWQGLWEPYLEEADNEGWLLSQLKKQTITNTMKLLRTNVKHVLTHRILLANFTLVEVDKKPILPKEYIWIQEDNIHNYAVPRLVEILLESIHDTY
ncbi:MAG: A/G-specific adenine glycosylase [Prevotella sp.]|nr:A/G-specific adenine glycosylase [Prevotella sp.]